MGNSCQAPEGSYPVCSSPAFTVEWTKSMGSFDASLPPFRRLVKYVQLPSEESGSFQFLTFPGKKPDCLVLPWSCDVRRLLRWPVNIFDLLLVSLFLTGFRATGHSCRQVVISRWESGLWIWLSLITCMTLDKSVISLFGLLPFFLKYCYESPLHLPL